MTRFLVALGLLVSASAAANKATCDVSKSCKSLSSGNVLQQLKTAVANQTGHFPSTVFSNETVACVRAYQQNTYTTACARFLNANGTLVDTVSNMTALLGNKCSSCGSVALPASGNDARFIVDASTTTIAAFTLPDNCISISAEQNLSAPFVPFLCPKGFVLPRGCQMNANCTLGKDIWAPPQYDHQSNSNTTVAPDRFQNAINTCISGFIDANPVPELDGADVNITAYMVRDWRRTGVDAYLYLPQQVNLTNETGAHLLNFLSLHYNGSFNEYTGSVYLDNRTKTQYSLVFNRLT